MTAKKKAVVGMTRQQGVSRLHLVEHVGTTAILTAPIRQPQPGNFMGGVQPLDAPPG